MTQQDLNFGIKLTKIESEQDAMRRDMQKMEKAYEEMGESVKSIEKAINEIAKVLQAMDFFEKKMDSLEDKYDESIKNGCPVLNSAITRVGKIEGIIDRANKIVWTAIVISILGFIGLKIS